MQATHQAWRGSEARAPRRRPITGPGASSRKYDVLTALATAGLSGSPGDRTSALRLIAMVTARYDWTADSVAFGHADLARLWSVSLRTAKREMRRLTESGMLVCLVPGVRGRVGVYRLDPGALSRLTETSWERVGPDFVARMGATSGDGTDPCPARVEVERADERIEDERDPPPGAEPDPYVEQTGGAGGPPEWLRLQRRLRTTEPAAFASWYGRLSFGGRAGSKLRIVAPSRFVASYIETRLAVPLGAAVRECFGPDVRLVLTTDPISAPEIGAASRGRRRREATGPATSPDKGSPSATTWLKARAPRNRDPSPS